MKHYWEESQHDMNWRHWKFETQDEGVRSAGCCQEKFLHCKADGGVARANVERRVVVSEVGPEIRTLATKGTRVTLPAEKSRVGRFPMSSLPLGSVYGGSREEMRSFWAFVQLEE